MPRLSDLYIKEIVDGKVDDYGRLYVGPDYKGEQRKVAILENRDRDGEGVADH